MKRAAPYVIVALLAAETAALHFFGRVEFVNELGVSLDLPAQVGGYAAVDFLFCQNDQCLQAVHVSPGEQRPATCPECGSALDTITLAEKTYLPSGTRIAKRSYRTLGLPDMHVSVVVAGRERRSIHKPQVCLVGQGYMIRNESVESIATRDGREVAVTFLDVIRRRGGKTVSRPVSYAYWFISPRRETPRHLERLFWIAADGVLFGKRHTWAYVAVSTSAPSQESARKAVEAFIAKLYGDLRPEASE